MKILKVVGWLAILLIIILGQEIMPGPGWTWLACLCISWYMHGWFEKALGSIRAMSERLTTVAENSAAIAADVRQINRRGAEMPLQGSRGEPVESPYSGESLSTTSMFSQQLSGGVSKQSASGAEQTASMPTKPVFGNIEGETWMQYQDRLEKYQSERDSWFLEEGRRQSRGGVSPRAIAGSQ